MDSCTPALCDAHLGRVIAVSACQAVALLERPNAAAANALNGGLPAERIIHAKPFTKDTGIASPKLGFVDVRFVKLIARSVIVPTIAIP